MDGRRGVTRREALAGLGAGVALSGCAGRRETTPSATNAPDYPGAPLPERPNIVVVYVDDLGWLDTGFQGSQYYDTPNLDALADEGVVATSGYANAPNCAPSRACFNTGQYTPRHGVGTVTDPPPRRPEARRLETPPNSERLGTDNATIAEVLSDAGYATGFVGKWHLGEADSRHGPLARGFDRNVGGDIVGRPPAGYFSPYRLPNVTDDGGYLPDRLTDDAIEFVADHAGGPDPFFLLFSTYSVHGPLQAPDDAVDAYRDVDCWNGQCNPTYGAMVSNLDANVGRLLAALDERGIREETLVVFTSDNGGLGDYDEIGLPRDWKRVTSQGPLRGGKRTLYEGGIRVPTVVSWPGVVPGGRRSSTPIAGTDFFPTFVDLAGAHDAVPDDHVVDGRSLVPWLTDGTPPDRDALFWHFPFYHAGASAGRPFQAEPVSVVRAGRWKLHRFYEGDRVELYDLANDRSERRNLASDRPAVRDRLRGTLDDWLNETDAPLPRPK
ncbi:sulfatase [Halosimplex carlsbadense 2-9-1]|uniref:Sulfatase n=1 Tax=Halosimplex carlsbadense 2-9-1 TaxID=797114 RepID=M0CV95_9EURY|nr:sulfatase [Halosimplex carlsbadense]ELZ26342.1 sulfatase [Halosimplex carlsbadense 2-9-1]